MGLRRSRAGRTPSLGAYDRADSATKTVVEWSRKVIVGFAVARLQRLVVGAREFSAPFLKGGIHKRMIEPPSGKGEDRAETAQRPSA